VNAEYSGNHRTITTTKKVHLTYINDRPPFKIVNHACWTLGLADKENYDFDGQPVILAGKPVTRFQWLAAQQRK